MQNVPLFSSFQPIQTVHIWSLHLHKWTSVGTLGGNFFYKRWPLVCLGGAHFWFPLEAAFPRFANFSWIKYILSLQCLLADLLTNEWLNSCIVVQSNFTLSLTMTKGERKGGSPQTLLFFSLQLCLHSSVTLYISFNCNIKSNNSRNHFSAALETHENNIYADKMHSIYCLLNLPKFNMLEYDLRQNESTDLLRAYYCYQDWLFYVGILALGYFTKCRCWALPGDAMWASGVLLGVCTHAFLCAWTR